MKRYPFAPIVTQPGEARTYAYIFGAAILLLWPLLLTPFGFDNAIYQSMAWELFRYGRIPYIESIDNNFPGIIYIHYVAIVLFGKGQPGFRILDIFLQAVMGIGLFNLWKSWLKPRTAFLAVVLYYLYYVSNDVYIYGQRDIYGALLLLVAAGLLVRREHLNAWRLLLAGVLAGYAVLMRPTFAALDLLLLGFIYETSVSIGQFLRRAGAFLCAAALPCLIVLIYYAAIPGGLEALYTAIVAFNRDLYLAVVGTRGNLANEIINLLGLGILASVPFVKKNRAALKAECTSTMTAIERTCIAIAFVLSCVFLLIQQKYLRYHFATTMLIVMPFAAVGIETITGGIKSLRNRNIARYCLAALATLYVTRSTVVPRGIGELAHGGRLHEIDRLQPSGPLALIRADDTARFYILHSTRADQTVEICSFEPYFRLALDREPAGIYPSLSSLALRLNTPGSLRPVYTTYQQREQAAYVARLARLKPEIIAFTRYTNYWAYHDPYRSTLLYLPGFDSLLRADYHYDTTFGWTQLLRRNPS